MTTSTTPIQKSPTDILQEQATSLSDIYKVQQEQLSLLRSQYGYLHQTLQIMEKNISSSQLLHVKIEDVNMPFWALVGFLLKLTFAWIPAAIVIVLLFYGIGLILGLIFGGIFY